MKTFIKSVDSMLAKAYLGIFGERDGLIILLFHGIFANEKDIVSGVIDPEPHHGITVNKFRQTIEYFLACNYKFISPDDILRGMGKNGKYALITFDDGYLNNLNALPVLKEFRAPALFFISSDNVLFNKSFWWDVIYRERRRAGASPKNICHEQKSLKLKAADEIERYILAEFGEGALKPEGDIDRPFSASELKNFSREEYVHIGNHSANHAILTNYPAEGIKAQILSCQGALCGITGKNPKVISYPNGAYSERAARIASEAGLKLGMTVKQKKNYLPINLQGADAFLLGRFLIEGNEELIPQCERLRSDISLYNTFKNRFSRVSF